MLRAEEAKAAEAKAREVAEEEQRHVQEAERLRAKAREANEAAALRADMEHQVENAQDRCLPQLQAVSVLDSSSIRLCSLQLLSSTIAAYMPEVAPAAAAKIACPPAGKQASS